MRQHHQNARSAPTAWPANLLIKPMPAARAARRTRIVSNPPKPASLPAHDFVIRRARASDEAAIVEIEQAAFTGDDPFSARQVRRLVANPRAEVFVSDDAGQITGWIVMLTRRTASPGNTRTGRLYGLAVLPSAVGRGIGRTLAIRGIDALERAGVRRIHLEVRSDNERAIGLYRSLGFTPIEPLPAYYGSDDGLRMRRQTNP